MVIGIIAIKKDIDEVANNKVKYVAKKYIIAPKTKDANGDKQSLETFPFLKLKYLRELVLNKTFS